MEHKEDSLLEEDAGGEGELLHGHDDHLVEVLDVVLDLALSIHRKS